MAKPEMPLEYAADLLRACAADILNDQGAGDAEISWCRGEKLAADGYFGGIARYVVLQETEDFAPTVFMGDDAQSLRYLGKKGTFHYNDGGEQRLL